MSTLEKLIAQLCPDGVEYRPLWCLTAWDKRFNSVDRAKQPTVITYHYFLANELTALAVANGTVKLLTTNSSNIFTTEALAGNKISKGEIVALPWGGNPNIQYYKGKFLTADNRIATSLDTGILDTKFLYYVLLSRTEEIGSYYRGSGIKHPDMSKVLAMKIPLPPLPVQKEIVRMLDDMAGLIDALEDELAARKKQYEWCRERLLTFGDDVERKALGEIAKVCRGVRVVKAQLSNDGKYPVYQNSITPLGYHLEYNCKAGTPFVIAAGAAGEIGYCDVDFWAADDCYYIETDKNLNGRFVYYCLMIMKLQLTSKVRKASVPRLARSFVDNLEIPLPSLPVQKEIVRKLDDMTTLIAALEEELAARKQQYEYYRDMLLAFKRKPEVV